MTPDTAHFDVRLALREADLLAAQRLRYRVFVEELGGDGPLIDHGRRLERDEFDPVNDHLVLIDTRRDECALDHVVGVYRLLRSDQAEAFGRAVRSALRCAARSIPDVRSIVTGSPSRQ